MVNSRIINCKFVIVACVCAVLLNVNNVSQTTIRQSRPFAVTFSIPAFTANVISLDRKSARFTHTVQLLQRLQIVSLHVVPPLQDSEVVMREVRKWNGTLPGPMSLKLAHFSIWNAFAANNSFLDSDFMLVFEDDIEMSSSVSQQDVVEVIESAARLSEYGSGFFYLGLCEPRCELATSQVLKSIVYTDCFGLCSHAYGLFKWRSKTLQRDLEVFRPRGNLEDDIDQLLFAGFSKSPIFPILAASNLSDGRAHLGHVGIFYQDRQSFPTELFTDKHWLPNYKS